MFERGSSGTNRGPRKPPRRGREGAPRWGPRPGQQPQKAKRAGGLGLRRVEGNIFELAHPRCVEEREDDYAEAMEMWRAGEPEDARDALRYALDGCGDNLWIHVALGRIALEASRDANLARGHYGYAIELVRRAIPRDFTGKLPPDRPANRPLYEALEGLLACYEALGRPRDGDELRRWADRLRRGA